MFKYSLKEACTDGFLIFINSDAVVDSKNLGTKFFAGGKLPLNNINHYKRATEILF